MVTKLRKLCCASSEDESVSDSSGENSVDFIENEIIILVISTLRFFVYILCKRIVLLFIFSL